MIDFHSLEDSQSCRMQEHLVMQKLTPVLRRGLDAVSFSRLRNSNIIEQRGHTVTIHNRSMLEHLAGFRAAVPARKLT